MARPIVHMRMHMHMQQRQATQAALETTWKN
jgi:hypothetical protein